MGDSLIHDSFVDSAKLGIRIYPVKQILSKR